jgi:hypothetical protein
MNSGRTGNMIVCTGMNKTVGGNDSAIGGMNWKVNGTDYWYDGISLNGSIIMDCGQNF